MTDQLVRDNIKRLKPYSSARSEYKGQAAVFLDANESPFDTGYNRYPDPLQQELKEAISAVKGVPPAQIFLGNGSDEAIDLLFRIFCEPGQDYVITLPPTYGMYQVSADIAGVGVREAPLRPGIFQPDPAAVLAQASPQSKLLFICSPNNPTGNSIRMEIMRELLGAFPGIVVVDEAYIDFSSQESALSLLGAFPNLVVLQTFSKAWGLAGIRLGMAFASEAIIAYFNKVKPPYNINQLTQEEALKALKGREAQEATVQQLLGQRALLQQYLGGLPFVQRIYPSDANFLLVKVDSPRAVYDYLAKGGIIVRDRSKIVLCEGCLRVTVGTPAENERLFRSLVSFEEENTNLAS